MEPKKIFLLKPYRNMLRIHRININTIRNTHFIKQKILYANKRFNCNFCKENSVELLDR